ncbi:hypothetical protein [Streptomyces sp. NPDC003688]
MATTVRAAHEAGVTVLAGTDSHPCGTVADEVAWLHRSGIPADLVAYDTDPTLTPQALPHSSRIILRGRIVR